MEVQTAVSRNPPIQSVNADLTDAALYADDPAASAGHLSRAAFLLALSRAFDMAVDRPPGHGQRVAFAAVMLARSLGLPAAELRQVLIAAALHDVGLIIETEDLACASGENEPQSADIVPFIARKIGDSLPLAPGDRLARVVGIESNEIAPHQALRRIVEVATRFEALTHEGVSPLVTRRILPSQLAPDESPDDDAAVAMSDLATSDEFWLGFYDNDLASSLVPYDLGEALSVDQAASVAAAIGDLVDERNCRPTGHSARVADFAYLLAESCEMARNRSSLVRLAACLQDIGTFGVSTAILRKPDILSVEEMAEMQQHPVLARDVLGEVPGLGTAAWWVGCHHERIDGKGYPSGLRGDEVPLEAQIIGVAETYYALTGARPYRAPLQPSEAAEVIRGMAGTRFLPSIVENVDRLLATGSVRS